MSNRFTLHHGDCIEVMRSMPDACVDSVVTDPPYELGFMGKSWDASGIAFNTDVWSEALRVLKPGGHLLAFSGSRTYHRMAVAIEDAGFEIRDQIMWIYGSGFPKSLDVSKAIDKRGGANITWFGPWFRQWREENGVTQKEVAALFPSKTGNLTGCVANWELGFNLPTADQFNLIRDTFNLPFASIEEAEREVLQVRRVQRNSTSWETNSGMLAEGEQNFDITAPATPEAQKWSGYGTALKPAHEPIVVARKPLQGTVAANVLAHGVGALNIDGCRVESGNDYHDLDVTQGGDHFSIGSDDKTRGTKFQPAQGRWPANVIHDGSDEVVALFPEKAGSWSGTPERSDGTVNREASWWGKKQTPNRAIVDNSMGSAARFFYCAKANKRDRNEGLDGFTAKQPDESRKEGNPGGDNPRNRGVNKRLNHHPTVKPTDLMRYLVRLITPPGATVLDPFMGSGSTGKAAMYEGVNFIGIEQDAEYLAIAKARIQFALNKPLEDQLFERTPPSNEELANQLALPLTNEESA